MTAAVETSKLVGLLTSHHNVSVTPRPSKNI